MPPSMASVSTARLRRPALPSWLQLSWSWRITWLYLALVLPLTLMGAGHGLLMPPSLSGGERQRAALARAIIMGPDVILADEPTGNLDETTGDAVMALLLRLVAQTGAGLLMVTHSPRLAARLDRRVHLSAGRLQLELAA